MKTNATIAYSFILAAVDFLSLVAAFIGGYILRGTLSSVPVANPIGIGTFLMIFASLIPFWIIVFAMLGLYRADIFEKRFREFGRLLIGAFIGLMFVTFWSFIEDKPIFPSKLVPIYGFIIGFVLVVILRNLVRLIRSILFKYKIGLTKVLVIGKSGAMSEIVKSLASSQQSGYKVIGVIGAKSIARKSDLLSFKSFKDFLNSETEKPDGIIQAELYSYESKNREILEYAQEHHINYRFLPGNSQLFVGRLEVELFSNSIPVIAVHQTPLFGWGRVVKRIFDIIVSGLALIILSPIFLIIFGLYAFSGGHPIYKRKRLTRFGHNFTIYKFRSVKNELNGLDPEDAFTKMGHPELIKTFRGNGDFIEHDPRISRLGKFLRATSLDELPQIINVFLGDISIVGPRALIEEELDQSQYKNRILSVKSGLTGLAVVSGRKDIPFDERRQIDLYYVQNWSFWLDVQIILKTFRVLLQKGAK